MAEAGVAGYEMVGWNGIFVAKGTPAGIVARLGTALAKVLSLPDVREQMATLGAEPGGDTPQAFGTFVSAEAARWGKIIREKGIRPE
jgi:tripartite-type tricarboxylate transporter receptor subunit TctC